MSWNVGEAEPHSPSLTSLHLRHSSFSNPSTALPTSQIILQPFRCFTYVIGTSPTSPCELPRPLWCLIYPWWFCNLQWLRPAGLYERCKFALELKRLKTPGIDNITKYLCCLKEAACALSRSLTPGVLLSSLSTCTVTQKIPWQIPSSFFYIRQGIFFCITVQYETGLRELPPSTGIRFNERGIRMKKKKMKFIENFLFFYTRQFFLIQYWYFVFFVLYYYRPRRT